MYISAIQSYSFKEIKKVKAEEKLSAISYKFVDNFANNIFNILLMINHYLIAIDFIHNNCNIILII